MSTFDEFLENKEAYFLIARYIIEMSILYILFRYKYKSISKELQLDLGLQEKLIADFKPEPLVDDVAYDPLAIPPFIGSNLIELADFDFYDLSNENKDEMCDVLRTYGVGTCGPPGFYGTLDLHLELEQKLSDMLGTEGSILYSNAFTCVNSVITCFCKQYDTVFYHENCNEAITRALGITRSSTLSFNNLDCLETKLKRFFDKKRRNFIVTEGLFRNTGEITNIRRLLSIKKKYKARIILDETLSIPLLGKRGISEFFDTDIMEIDVIIGSLAHIFCGNGGFASGSKTAMDYQRLSAQSYCFSASLPGFLTMNAMKNIERKYDLIDSHQFLNTFESSMYSIISSEYSPMIVITSNVFLQENKADSHEELKNLRSIKEALIKNGVRIGIIENPLPSIRICLKKNIKEKDVKALTRKIMRALNK